MKPKTRKEFIDYNRAWEEGYVAAIKHQMTICKLLIKAHKADFTKEALEKRANLNSHLWEEEKNGILG